MNMLIFWIGHVFAGSVALGLRHDTLTAPGYPTESVDPAATSVYFTPNVKSVNAYGKLPHKKLAELPTYVSRYLAPHQETLFCHGLNSSYNMHINARITLGCSLAKETEVAPAYKYSKCEEDLLRKFVLCQDGDHACFIHMLEELGNCKDVCCRNELKLCQAAICKGLERSFVYVKEAFALCKDRLYSNPIVDGQCTQCPVLNDLWLECMPWVTAALRGCQVYSSSELVNYCVKAALSAHGRDECLPCVSRDPVYCGDDVDGDDADLLDTVNVIPIIFTRRFP